MFPKRTGNIFGESSGALVAEVGTWGRVQGVQNVPRSAWVKTDAASRRVSTDIAFAVLPAASVFTYALPGTFCTPCTPQVPKHKPKPKPKPNAHL
jgi:hypothetical protein